MLKCSLCGAEQVCFSEVLWHELIVQWQLSEEEEGYINEQQGGYCANCGASLRAIALGDALREAWGTQLLLRNFCREPRGCAVASARSQRLRQSVGPARADARLHSGRLSIRGHAGAALP